MATYNSRILTLLTFSVISVSCSLNSPKIHDRYLASTAILDQNGKELGREVIPPEETAATEEILKLVKQGYAHHSSRSGNDPARRIIHGKHHGCVQADFRVNSDLPKKLRHGIFLPGARFPAWVRLSNGSGETNHDSRPDGRGLAIKLMKVDGEKLGNEKHTQDLLLQNAPNFFAADVASYVSFMKFAAYPGMKGVSEFLSSANIKTHRDRKAIGILVKSGTSIKNPLTAEYYSALPQRLGPYAMKLRARPCKGQVAPDSGLFQRFDKNFLSEVMTKHLKKRDACIEIAVQVQTDASLMPIEDATVIWDQKKSPFISVAEVRIPAQEFNSERRKDFCENISYSPWNSINDHRPLGGLNRVRRAVYEHSQGHRHHLNHQSKSEPNPDETYE